MNDEIHHPKHYQLFPGMEAIDIIEAALTPEQFEGYLMGNALKYRLRAGEKGDALTDLGKARWYQDRLRIAPYSSDEGQYFRLVRHGDEVAWEPIR